MWTNWNFSLQIKWEVSPFSTKKKKKKQILKSSIPKRQFHRKIIMARNTGRVMSKAGNGVLDVIHWVMNRRSAKNAICTRIFAYINLEEKKRDFRVNMIDKPDGYAWQATGTNRILTSVWHERDFNFQKNQLNTHCMKKLFKKCPFFLRESVFRLLPC